MWTTHFTTFKLSIPGKRVLFKSDSTCTAKRNYQFLKLNIHKFYRVIFTSRKGSLGLPRVLHMILIIITFIKLNFSCAIFLVGLFFDHLFYTNAILPSSIPFRLQVFTLLFLHYHLFWVFSCSILFTLPIFQPFHLDKFPPIQLH